MLTTVSEQKAFGGTVGYYSHESERCRCTMRFAVFIPPQAKDGAKVPVVTWLSGLTCTEDNFTVKAGAQRMAAELGLMIIAPDTSPRGDDVPDDDNYDMGKGAGFYLDATEPPWDTHYHMYSYITQELPELVFANFPGERSRQGIMGHSMGGHGALTIWLKNLDTYKSVSAFAPICAPMQCPWGQKALPKYLGDNREAWLDYDTCELLKTSGDGSQRPEILVDQGLADNFLAEQLKPELLEEACQAVGQKLTLRRQPGYDHSYFFIASFMDDHLRHHARHLQQ